jgi:WD40 repeat protein
MQTGHVAQVMAIAFSPDGKALASASANDENTIKLWDTSSGAELRSLNGHTDRILSVVFSPDGKTLISGSGDKSIRLWDVQTGVQMRTLSSDSVGSLALSPDGKILASCSYDKTVRLLDASTGTEIRILKGFADDFHSVTFIPGVTFSPDGKILAVSERFKITLFDLSTGTEIRAFKAPWGTASAAFSPDGKLLASGSETNEIQLWDLSTGTELRKYAQHGMFVDALAFSPDGKTLAAGHYDGISLWDINSGSVTRILKGHTHWITSVAYSPNGKTLASASLDRSVKLWDASTGRELHNLTARSSVVISATVSPDGKTIVGGSDDNKIRLWDVSTLAGLRTFTGHSKSVFLLAFSPDGNILASGSYDDTFKLWDISTGTRLRELFSWETFHFRGTLGLISRLQSYPITSMAFSPDGRILAGGYYNYAEATMGPRDDTIKLWSVSTGAELRSLYGHRNAVNSVAFSPDGKTLASGSADTTIRLWDVSTGRELRKIIGHSASVSAVTFSPDGRLLASGSKAEENAVKLWDLSSGTELRTLKGHSDSVRSVAFSPDGKTLVTASKDKTIRVWDVSTGSELHILKVLHSEATSATFSPDGRYLISTGDASIRVWDPKSGRELASLIALDDHDWVVVTPDGLFDGSPAAWNKIIWRFNNNTFDHAPVEAFFNEFYYPGLLSDLFAGKRPKAPSDISQKDRRQPQLKLSLRDAQANAPSPARDVGGNPTVREGARNLAVRIDISESAADKDHKTGSGAQDVRLFRNGSLVKVWRGDVLKGQNSVTLEATVPIVAGENKFTAYAFNRDNIKSSDAELTVPGADSLKRQGTAYVLAVGVNNYANDQYNLKYAVADAEDFAAEVKRQQEALKRYAKVEVISLSDTQATKANIEAKLAELAKKVEPEDAVIVFFAGHGTAQGNQFYLIPHDLGYDGPRENLSAAGLQTILDHSVSDRELERLFEGIDAGQLLLVIDACNSGQALEAEEKRRGPMNSKGLAQLAYEKGMYVLTAAQSYQAAQEAAKFGHGFLTYALVEEGLKQGAADREPKNGSIDIREWLNFATDEVPRMQENNSLEALRGRGRYVVFVGDGTPDRTLDRDKTPPGNANNTADYKARDNVQRPRVFYRRELETNPLVIGSAGGVSPR